ncbi:MAG: GNAT family N-acetyltransferase [Lachnospiraceae bacterium]
MQNIIYRKLEPKDLNTFIEMRIRQLQEEGAEPTFDLAPALRDYYNRHIAIGTFVSWLALDDERIVGTSGLSITERPPYYGNPTGKTGILSSMFTLSEFRRKGIARSLLTKIVAEAKARNCKMIQISASDMGMHLYRDFGFVKNNKFMQYQMI